MDDKVTYNTLVRIAGSWRPYGPAFRAVMDFYGWRRVALVTDIANWISYYAANAIRNELMSRPGYQVEWITMSATPGDSDINDYVEKVRQKARSKLSNHFHTATVYSTQFTQFTIKLRLIQRRVMTTS